MRSLGYNRMKNLTTRRMKPGKSEEDAVRHSESEDDSDEPEKDNFIFLSVMLKCSF